MGAKVLNVLQHDVQNQTLKVRAKSLPKVLSNIIVMQHDVS